MVTKKRLLIFQPYLSPYRVDLMNDLCEAFDARVLFTYADRAGQAFDQSKLSHLARFPYDVLPQGSRLAQVQAARREIKRFAPDLVLVLEFNHFAVCALLQRFFSRKTFQVISLCDDSFDMVHGHEFTRLHRLARRVVASHLDEIVNVEPRVADWYRQHYGHGFFFPIIQDEARVRGTYKEALTFKDACIQSHGLEGKRVFLFVGRLVRIKGVDTLLRAFAQFQQEDDVLVIVGDGPEKEPLMRLSAQLHCHTLFTGFLEGPALAVWYIIAQIFILPSFLEPFGAVTNEALIGGCYCLVSDKTGSQCLVRDGVNGYVFQTMDVDDLAVKLSLACSLPDNAAPQGDVRPSKMLLAYRDLIGEFIRHLQTL